MFNRIARLGATAACVAALSVGATAAIAAPAPDVAGATSHMETAPDTHAPTPVYALVVKEAGENSSRSLFFIFSCFSSGEACGKAILETPEARQVHADNLHAVPGDLSLEDAATHIGHHIYNHYQQNSGGSDESGFSRHPASVAWTLTQ